MCTNHHNAIVQDPIRTQCCAEPRAFVNPQSPIKNGCYPPNAFRSTFKLFGTAVSGFSFPSISSETYPV